MKNPLLQWVEGEMCLLWMRWLFHDDWRSSWKHTHTHTHTHTNPNSIVVARKWAKLISSRAPDENQSGVADSPAADPRHRGPGRNENRSPCHHAASLISHAAGREARDESRFTVTTGESQRCTGQIKKKKNAQSHDHTFTSGRAHPNECRHVTAQTRFF